MIFVYLIFLNLLSLFVCDEEPLTPTNCVKTRLFSRNCRSEENPDIKFYLYTRNNIKYGEELMAYNRKSFKISNFNRKWPIRIFIHGWKGEHRSCACAIVKDAYLRRDNFNVIIMDWSDLACQSLEKASDNVQIAGEKLAEFTDFLTNLYSISYANIYLIGHSLGAHIAGHAGSLIHPHKYNTIFALDPAAPFFLDKNRNERLDPSDAYYVESITTDINIAAIDTANIADASIYPNFGKRYQPECLRKKFIDPLCNHRMAVKYFADTIRYPDTFCATKTTWRNLHESNEDLGENLKEKKYCEYFMGGEPSEPKNGVFYVLTED